jgi:oxaloacetate decarboxylase (Na+ extruding) subunit alpha
VATIELVDVSIRDGNQSLWGATRFPTRQILQIAPVLDRVGLRAVDFTSSTHMGIAVRNHRENPWERIRRTHAAMPHTPLQFITGFRFISWETAHPDFMKLVYERLVANGISRFALLDPMHEMTNLLSSAKAIKEAGGEVVAALIYTLSEVHDDTLYAGLAKQMASCPSIDRVYIKDPSGLLTPERARTLVPALLAALDGKPLELHSHTTIGLSGRTYVLVPDLGIEVVQTACGPLSNGSSLPDVHRVVSNLRAMGHTVDVDDRLLDVVAEYFTRIALAERLPFGTPQEFDAAFLQHQLAGGTLTTTRRQLTELGLEERYDELIDEVTTVRAELGYPIMVTPFPQIVVQQALSNLIGGERYGIVSDQLIRYVLGRFGRPASRIEPQAQDRILAQRRAKEIEREPGPAPPDEQRKAFRRGISDEEFLLRATMPEQQVDAMLAAGPAANSYNPDLEPVKELLRELKTRPRLSHLVVEKDGFRLAVGEAREPAMGTAGRGAG